MNPAGPDGPVVAGGPLACVRDAVSKFLWESGSVRAFGSAGPYVAGALLAQMFRPKVLEPLEHLVLDHADPAGQHAAVGTLSPSDCCPAGPAGPCIAGGPVGPDDFLKILEPLEHSVLDHADPAGQHADFQDTVESLEHSDLDTILGCHPMEGITCPELLEHALLDTTLDGGLVEKISDWEPVAHPVPDATLDGLWRGLPTRSR